MIWQPSNKTPQHSSQWILSRERPVFVMPAFTGWRDKCRRYTRTSRADAARDAALRVNLTENCRSRRTVQCLTKNVYNTPRVSGPGRPGFRGSVTLGLNIHELHLSCCRLNNPDSQSLCFYPYCWDKGQTVSQTVIVKYLDYYLIIVFSLFIIQVFRRLVLEMKLSCKWCWNGYSHISKTKSKLCGERNAWKKL